MHNNTYNLPNILLLSPIISSSKLWYADAVSIAFSYYHSDHLGSASWITNKTGTPVQHLQYMPYGEPLVNERTSSYNERFTSTGKTCSPLLHYHCVNHANSCGNAIANSPGLLHAETGFSYFGARYYDSDLMTG